MASGFYHSYNTLKYRILHVLVEADAPLTSLEIADSIGIDRKRVSDALYHWHKCNYGYVRRKGKRGKYYLYSIAKHGIRANLSYDARFKKGLSLNMKASSPKKMESVLDYFGISEKGKELGYSKTDLPELAGLKRNQT